MVLKTLTLQNFKSHSYFQCDFKNGISIFEGQNGVGKTNILEAINYLSTARSFRKIEDIKLIKEGNEYGEINTVIEEGIFKKNIKIVFYHKGRQIYINNKRIERISQLASVVNVILFEPNDVGLFKDTPKRRRYFLNNALLKKSNIYLNELIKYQKILEERNKLLKQENIDDNLLDILTDRLIESSDVIINYRMSYIKNINSIISDISTQLFGKKTDVKIVYKSFIEYDENFKEKAKQLFLKNKSKEIANKATLFGVHKEDFETLFNDKNIAQYGSQGENRLVALALTLSPYFLEENEDKKPIILLDDVMSELDDNHQQLLIKFLKKFKQTFITATKLNINNAESYQIK